MILNGKEYEIPEIDFNMICDLENAGVSLLEIQDKPMVSIRGFLSVVGGLSAEEAGVEIQQHIVNGGDITPIITEIMKALINSGFFQSLLPEEDREILKEEVGNIEKILTE